jgi:dTDP-4-amino-4,6-dideoxygalactose transaminase
MSAENENLLHLDFEGWITRRHALAYIYDQGLRNLPLILQQRPKGVRSALHLYVVQLDDHQRAMNKKINLIVRLFTTGCVAEI